MKKLRVRRPSAPMAVAFVALVAALSGTAAALPGKNAVVFGDTHDHDGTTGDGNTQNEDFDTGDVVDLLLHSADGQGFEINYSNPNGTEIFVKTQNWEDTGFLPGADCQVGGFAILLP